MSPLAHPYKYPSKPRTRRHAPRGYKQHRDYRPWLEDEFHFRCAYCLKRTVWAPTDVWCVEHLVPQTVDATQKCHYENLVFACQWCNEKKLSRSAPDPMSVAYGNCLRINDATAEVEPLNEKGEMLIRTLKLNHRDQLDERRNRLRNLSILASVDVNLWKSLMGFPKNLPNLATKKPPLGNDRPEGIRDSCYERRLHGQLPEWYEE